MTLLLVTQHYDAIQDVARNSGTNTVMMNYSPGGVGDVANQIREAVLSVKGGVTTPTGGPAGQRGLPGTPPNSHRAA